MRHFSYQIGNDNTSTTAPESNTSSINENNTNSLPGKTNEDIDPSILDTINEVEDCVNPNSINGDDLIEAEKDLNDSELFPNNDFCFTTDEFIESINNINDETRYRGNHNITWSRNKDLEIVEYIPNAAYKDDPITQKVIHVATKMCLKTNVRRR